VLEQHEAETERLVKQWKSNPDKVKFSAWVKPKAERRRLLNSIVQRNVHFIFCFRAKEKLKIIPGKEPVHLGWQAIAGDEFIYEMTMSLYLPPGGKGRPDLQPSEIGEKALLKIPQQFRELVKARELDEDLGEALARWAMGDAGNGKPSAAPAADHAPQGGKAGLLLEVVEVLREHLGTDQTAAGAAVQEAFGCTWKKLQSLPADQLAVGLDALTKNLEGLAAMRSALPREPAREREPGEDD